MVRRGNATGILFACGLLTFKQAQARRTGCFHEDEGSVYYDSTNILLHTTVHPTMSMSMLSGFRRTWFEDALAITSWWKKEVQYTLRAIPSAGLLFSDPGL